MSALDPSSFSNFNDYITKHINLDWKINFETKTIDGIVVLSIKRLNAFVPGLCLVSQIIFNGLIQLHKLFLKVFCIYFDARNIF